MQNHAEDEHDSGEGDMSDSSVDNNNGRPNNDAARRRKWNAVAKDEGPA
jgi:hypothetical protein